MLDIRLLNSANSNSTLFTVVGGGVIDLPLAGGTISVAGLTPEEIQNAIRQNLKDEQSKRRRKCRSECASISATR